MHHFCVAETFSGSDSGASGDGLSEVLRDSRFAARFSGRIYANGYAAAHITKATAISITECCFKNTVDMLTSIAVMVKASRQSGVRSLSLFHAVKSTAKEPIT